MEAPEASRPKASPESAPGANSINERAAFVPQNTGKSNKQWAVGSGQWAVQERATSSAEHLVLTAHCPLPLFDAERI
jgi:hypothetical protein